MTVSACREESKDGPGSAQWCPEIGQEARGRNAQKVPPEHEEEIFHCAVIGNWDRSHREGVNLPHRRLA